MNLQLVLKDRGEGLAETPREGSPWHSAARAWTEETEDGRTHKPRSNRFLAAVRAIREGGSSKTVWQALTAERSRNRAAAQRQKLTEDAALVRFARGDTHICLSVHVHTCTCHKELLLEALRFPSIPYSSYTMMSQRVR